MNSNELKLFLNNKVKQYNRLAFIDEDPISIPHLFSDKKDIEIMGLFAATFAWGQRKTILNKCKELVELFDSAPIDFILNHSSKDLKRLEGFNHRTFNSTDLLYFVDFLKRHYLVNESLESAFTKNLTANIFSEFEEPIGNYLANFRFNFFSDPDSPNRTKKHISSPIQGSTCKRLNMFLRWMVRKDKVGVDFGIWNAIQTKDLICPIDLHVERIARRFSLITRMQIDWKTAIELTENLRKFDNKDPIKYDFALFGMGVEERYAL